MMDETTVLRRFEQVMIEEQFSRKGIRKHIREEVMNSLEELELIYNRMITAINNYRENTYYKSKNERIMHIANISTGDLVIEMMIAIIGQVGQIQKMAAQITYALKFEEDNLFDGVKTAAELIGACKDTGLYDIFVDPLEIESKVQFNPDIEAYIERTRYLDPMITIPDDWVSNTKGGYITEKDHVILKNNRHNRNQALDALNIVQHIEWELDKDTLKEQERPEKEFEDQDQREAFTLMSDMSKVVYSEIGNKPFYFVWRYDFRGRMYSQGYYINLQSTLYKKALLNFTHKEIITA